mmetsp:Transcript_42018/g.58742  ORF Transcript_42018/g.58742 Transcript_42018/m.58742 type:complete len:140 (+) Transcript_42018:104-523(+)
MDPNITEDSGQGKQMTVEEKAKLQMKQANIDTDFLEQLEQDVLSCSRAIEELLSQTRFTVGKMTQLSIQNMEALKVSADSTSDCVNSAVGSAHKFIKKCQELNEVFKGVEPLALQIKQIKMMLDAYEKFVAQLEIKPIK